MASVAVASDVRDSTKNQQKEKVGLTKQIESNECMQAFYLLNDISKAKEMESGEKNSTINIDIDEDLEIELERSFEKEVTENPETKEQLEKMYPTNDMHPTNHSVSSKESYNSRHSLDLVDLNRLANEFEDFKKFVSTEFITIKHVVTEFTSTSHQEDNGTLVKENERLKQELRESRSIVNFLINVSSRQNHSSGKNDTFNRNISNTESKQRENYYISKWLIPKGASHIKNTGEQNTDRNDWIIPKRTFSKKNMDEMIGEKNCFLELSNKYDIFNNNYDENANNLNHENETDTCQNIKKKNQKILT